MFVNDQQVKQFVVAKVNEMTEFAIKSGWVKEGWKCDVHISSSPTRRISRGGVWAKGAGIRLATRRYMNTLTASLIEYKQFRNRSDIGSVHGSVEKALTALVAHEFAHAVQFSSTTSAASALNFEGDDLGGHGVFWKKLYLVLRNEFVNGKEFEPFQASLEVKQFSAPRKGTKKSHAFEIYKSLVNSSKETIIRSIMRELNVTRSNAMCYLYNIEKML